MDQDDHNHRIRRVGDIKTIKMLAPSPGRRLSEQADPASQAVAQPPSGRSLVAADAMHELGLQVCEWAPSPIATRA